MKTTNKHLNDLLAQKQQMLAELQKQINEFKDLRDTLNPNNAQYDNLKAELDQFITALEKSYNFFLKDDTNIAKPCFNDPLDI